MPVYWAAINVGPRPGQITWPLYLRAIYFVILTSMLMTQFIFSLRYSICAKGFERLLFLSLCNGLASFCQLSLFRADELMHFLRQIEKGLTNLKWFWYCYKSNISLYNSGISTQKAKKKTIVTYSFWFDFNLLLQDP